MEEGGERRTKIPKEGSEEMGKERRERRERRRKERQKDLEKGMTEQESGGGEGRRRGAG